MAKFRFQDLETCPVKYRPRGLDNNSSATWPVLVVPRKLISYLTGVWQMAIEIAGELFDIAYDLDRKRLYRFAEQLRGAGMSMSNNTRPVK